MRRYGTDGKGHEIIDDFLDRATCVVLLDYSRFARTRDNAESRPLNSSREFVDSANPALINSKLIDYLIAAAEQTPAVLTCASPFPT